MFSVMLLKGIFTNFIISKSMFQIVFLISIIISVLTSPIDRNESENNENQPDFVNQNDSVDQKDSLEQEKIILEIKTKILQKLNMKEPPKFNTTFDWSSMADQIKSVALKQGIAIEDLLESSEPLKESIIISLIKLNQCNKNFSTNQQCFDLTLPDLKNKPILDAKLILPFLPKAFDLTNEDKISYNLSIKNQPEPVYNIFIADLKSNTLTIDLTTILKKRQITNSLSLIISIIGNNKTVLIEQIIDIDNIVLELEYQVPSAPIRKRREVSNICVPNQYFCCTQTLKVSLEDLGWTQFIVAPKTFTINYCRGDCNSYIPHSSNHVRALNFARKKESIPAKDTRACCVPYSYSGLMLMYLNDSNQIEVATLNDLIATTCGCM